MMARAALYLLEFLGLFGLVGMVAFITWTKMILGSVLALVGAFFPRVQGNDSAEHGSGKIDFGKVAVNLVGGVRILVILGGIILIVGSVLDGHEGYVAKAREKERVHDAVTRQELRELMDRIEADAADTRRDIARREKYRQMFEKNAEIAPPAQQ